MGKKILVPVEVPKNYYKLESLYEEYYTTYHATFNKDRKPFNPSTIDQSEQKLFSLVLKMIDVINQNRKEFEPIKKVQLFKDIDQLITVFKRLLVDNSYILHLRKCSNWIRTVDPDDKSYFL